MCIVGHVASFALEEGSDETVRSLRELAKAVLFYLSQRQLDLLEASDCAIVHETFANKGEVVHHPHSLACTSRIQPVVLTISPHILQLSLPCPGG